MVVLKPRRLTALIATLTFLSPSLAAAQAPRAGIVTTLEGSVTARRVALPAPVPLKFKDDVFLQDTVTTGDKSLARMLLGGKAVVTVRERTVLTITEIPGKSTIDLESGKFALAVAREKMRPGEEILIRTPNAVAGVRGTVVITEVARQGAQAGAGPAAAQTSFYVLRGNIYAQPLDPTTRQPMGNPLTVGTLQAYSQLGGAAGRVGPVSTEQLKQITSGLQPSGPKSSDAGQEQVKDQAVQTAVTLVTALTGGGDTQTSFLISPSGLTLLSIPNNVPTNVVQPPVPEKVEEQKENEGQTNEQAQKVEEQNDQPQNAGQQNQQPENEEQQNQNPAQVPAQNPQEPTEQPTQNPSPQFSFGNLVLSGTQVLTQTAPLVDITGQILTSEGGQPLVLVTSGADITMASALAHVRDSTIVGDGAGVDIRGKIRSSHTGPFIDLDPTLISVAGSMLSVIGLGAQLTLDGPLLKDVGGVLISGSGLQTQAFFAVLDGGVVRGNDPLSDSLPFISLTNSTVFSQGPFFIARRSGPETPSLVELERPFLDATGGSITSVGFTLLDQSGAPRLCCSFFGVGQAARFSSTTPLPLASLTDMLLVAGHHIFVVFDTTSVFGEPTIVEPGILTLSGPLVRAVRTGIAGMSDFLGIFRSHVRGFGTDPLITLEDSAVVMGGVSPINGALTAGRLLNLTASAALGATLELDGPLLRAVNSNIVTTDDVFGIFQGGRLISTSPSPLIEVQGGSITAGLAPTARDGSFFIVTSSVDATSEVTLAGPLLKAVDTALTNGLPGLAGVNHSPPFITFRDGALVQAGTAAPTTPFLFLQNTTVDTAGNFFDVRRNASVLLESPLLHASGSLIDVTSLGFGPTCCNFVRLGQGASVEGHSTAPFIDLANTTINAGDGEGGGNIVRVADVGSVETDVPAPSELSLASGLIRAVNGSVLTSLFNTLTVERSTLVSSSADPLIDLQSSTLEAGGRLALVISSPTSGTEGAATNLALKGSLLNASNSFVDTVSDLIGVFNGGVLSSVQAASPLVTLGNTTLTVGRVEGGPEGNILNVSGLGVTPEQNALVEATAGLLSLTGGVSTIHGALVRAANGGQLASEHPTQPLVAIDGGTHGVATNVGRAAFELFGRSGFTAFDEESSLTLGTDQPLRHTGAGAFLNLSGGAVVNAQRIAAIDTALLEASAPLLNITGTSNNTSMTVAVSGLDLIQKAKLTTTGPLFSVHAGVLNINGHAVRAMGASFLKIGGDLFKISGNGLVNIANGGAIFASGGSVVNVNGGIVNFVNGGGTFNLSNALCAPSCTQIGGINVKLQNGAVPQNVVVTDPIKGNGTANLGGSSSAVIVVDGPNTKVTVGGTGAGI